MPQNLTQEQLWQIFQKLPEETQKLILSEETAKNIFDICDENGIGVDEISEVGRYAGQVLMGALPIGEFANVLEKEAGLKKETAAKISEEIQETIFSQIGQGPIAAKRPQKPDIYHESIE